MMDWFQGYILHWFSSRLLCTSVVAVWGRNVEVGWIIFRSKMIIVKYSF